MKNTRHFIYNLLLLLLVTEYGAAQEFPQMVDVAGGSFWMGETSADVTSRRHEVVLSAFRIAQTETTVAQWRVYCEAVNIAMPSPPEWGWQEDHPIVNVSWNDVSKYVDWLSKRSGKIYRLPTEAEWEFAAKGGVRENITLYSGSDEIKEVAWFAGNAESQTHPVRSKKPNALGLYEMSGNAAEFCQDRFGSYTRRKVMNPKGNQTSFFRIVRGGSWYNTSALCTPTHREKVAATPRFDYIGFRVAEEISK